MQYKANSAYKNLVNQIYDDTKRQELLGVLGKHTLEVASGGTSRQEAVRNCIKEFSQKGIPAFVDKRGREWSPEAYINMDIRTTVNNTANAAQDACCDKYGLDLIQISSHMGARPKCALDQGKLVSRSNRRGIAHDGDGNPIPFIPLSDTSYGQPDGIFGINCHHKKYPFADGVNFQRYFPYDQEENAERYKEFQKQRAMERRVRETSRRADMLEAAGDTEGAKAARRQLRDQRKAYREYSNEHGLAVHNDRLTVVKVQNGDASYKNIYSSGLTENGKNGIIKNIVIPNEIHSIKGMSDELVNEISNSFDRIHSEYNVKIDSTPVKPLGKGFERVPFQFQSNSNGVSFSLDIVINADYDFNGSLEAFENRIMKNHLSGTLAAQSVEDLLWHEAVHVMTFQNCSNYREVLSLNDKLMPMYEKGVSKYSDRCFDGTETMAEAFVKKRHGYQIPESIDELLKYYVERWRK